MTYRTFGRSRHLALVCVLGVSGCAVGGADDAPEGEPEARVFISANELAPTGDELASAEDVAPRADGFQPTSVDLRAKFGPVRNQAMRGSCLAFATAGLAEFFVNTANGDTSADLSEQTLVYDALVTHEGYQQGRTGTVATHYAAAAVETGFVPESAWPYQSFGWTDTYGHDECDDPATASVLCFTNGEPPEAVHDAERVYLADMKMVVASVDNIRNHLATAGTPISVSFYVNEQEWDDGVVTLPPDLETDPDIGHAVLIVGYDDDKVVSITVPGEAGEPETLEQKGFLLIRNSWGSLWGESGYGWVSYDYARYNFIRAEVSTGISAAPAPSPAP